MKAEKLIKDYTRRCSNELIFTTEEDKTCKEYSPWLTPDQALSAVKIAREEVIDKVCEWLEEHSHKYMKYHEGLGYTAYVYDKGELVADLKKEMK